MDFDLANDGCKTASQKKCASSAMKLEGSAMSLKQQQIAEPESEDFLDSHTMKTSKSAMDLNQQHNGGEQGEDFLGCA